VAVGVAVGVTVGVGVTVLVGNSVGVIVGVGVGVGATMSLPTLVQPVTASARKTTSARDQIFAYARYCCSTMTILSGLYFCFQRGRNVRVLPATVASQASET